MRQGRMAAQVGHIVQDITEECVRDMYEKFPVPEHCTDYMKWSNNRTKIVYGATEEELRELAKLDSARVFIDTLNDNTKEFTVVGFLPGSIDKSVLSHLKLV